MADAPAMAMAVVRADMCQWWRRRSADDRGRVAPKMSSSLPFSASARFIIHVRDSVNWGGRVTPLSHSAVMGTKRALRGHADCHE